MKPIRAIVVLSFALLASCGNSGADKKNTTSSSENQFVPFSQRIGSSDGNGSRDPNSPKLDSKGKLKMDSAKRSPYESKGQASIGGKTYQKKAYKAGDYAKKSWWGNKDYGSKSYAGNTDGSRFQTSSRLDGQGAPESGNQAKIPEKYNTGDYATGAAREASNSVNRDSGTAAREQGRTNDEYQWDGPRNISVDQSRSLLGR